MRRPGKSVILLLLIFIFGTVISGAIAVDGAVGNTEANLRRGMRPIVTFEIDDDALEAYMDEKGLAWDDPDAPKIESVTPEMVRKIGELPYVDHYEYSVTSTATVTDFKAFDVWNPEGEETSLLLFRGTSKAELLQVREGVVDLVDGRTFTEEELSTSGDVNPIILSAGFARINNLSVGDVMEIPKRMFFLQPPGMWDENWNLNPENMFAEEVYTFEIIGLIDSAAELDHEDRSPENEERMNRLSSILSNIYVPNVVAEEMARFDLEQFPLMLNHMVENGMELDEWMEKQAEMNDDASSDEVGVTSIMTLNDPLEMDAFIEAAEGILPEYWAVSSLSGGFDEISSSMETLQSIASSVLVVSVGATLLILSLLITLFLRDRRYEMGVYLALGEKKGRIVTQILLEVVSIAIIGITLAVFTGNMISGSMSRNMLRNELTAEHNTPNQHLIGGSEFDQLGLSNEMTPEEMMEAFEVSLNIGTISLFYVVGLGAVIFSTIVPVVYVVTLNPKKVLM